MNEIDRILSVDSMYLDKAESILDVACGKGKFFESSSKEYLFTMIGIDIDTDVLKLARKKNIPNTKFLYGDMSRFKLNKRFDIITCFDAIDHDPRLIDNIDKVLVNFYRHLNEKGALIFCLPLSIGKALRINKVRAVAQKLGFRVTVFDGESKRVWTNDSKSEPVFLCLK